MKQTKNTPWFTWLGGYLLIPHELLHIFGFWLVGKRCKYRWGQPYVTPIGPMSRRALLVGRLMPFVAFTLLFFIATVLAGLAYAQVLQGKTVFWFVVWLVLMQLAALYASTTFIDLRQAYLLLKNKPWPSQTPFDIFFWPVVDWEDVRKKAAEEEGQDG